MQWSTEPNAGFSKNNKPASPVISSGPYGYQHVNAAQQRREPNSLLNWAERLIRMRKEVPEIGWGDFQLLATGDEAVLVIRYDWRNNSVVFVHNLKGTPREVGFDVGLPSEDARSLVNLLSGDHSRSRNSRHHMLLEGYGYRWFRVGGLDYLLKRSTVDEGSKARGAVRRGRTGA